jgi:hypothetical protein
MAQVFPFNRNKANKDGPFNPFTAENNPLRGSEDDPAIYIARPGLDFFVPWLAVDMAKGPAFVWPLAVEGLEITVDPTLGIHRFIGDDRVYVDVVHRGEERITLSGNFPGDTGPDNLRALREIVYAITPKLGKVLYVPHAFTYAQRVVVNRFRGGRTEDMRGLDLTYEVEFVRIGYINAGKADNDPILAEPIPQPTTGSVNASTHRVQADGKHNTLRKIALWKLGSAAKWNSLYTLNLKWFQKQGVPASKAPDYRLPAGTTIYY